MIKRFLKWIEKKIAIENARYLKKICKNTNSSCEGCPFLSVEDKKVYDENSCKLTRESPDFWKV